MATASAAKNSRPAWPALTKVLVGPASRRRNSIAPWPPFAARDTLLKCDDHEARHQAVRINWNLSEIAAGQGRWAEALETLDAYLEHSPVEVEPYEKKLELLHKLDRDRDIVPALRKYAAREEFHLGLQLLLARELTKDTRNARRSQRRCTGHCWRRTSSPRSTAGSSISSRPRNKRTRCSICSMKPCRSFAQGKRVKATDRESAQERARAMLTVLRTDSELVAAMLPEAKAELGRDKERQSDTWVLLANLAARHRQLDAAEKFFRQCLVNLPTDPRGVRLRRSHPDPDAPAEVCRCRDPVRQV